MHGARTKATLPELLLPWAASKDTAMWITWKHQDSDFVQPITAETIENKIDIFYERCFGWQLHIADLMTNGGKGLDGKQHETLRHSGFAVLQVCLSYFEAVGKLRDGYIKDDKSRHYFKLGFRGVFPNSVAGIPGTALNVLLDKLYEAGRCGLYHASTVGPNLGLGQCSGAMEFHPPDILVVNPEELPRALKKHLEQFRAELLDPVNAQLRSNFVRRFDHVHSA